MRGTDLISPSIIKYNFQHIGLSSTENNFSYSYKKLIFIMIYAADFQTSNSCATSDDR